MAIDSLGELRRIMNKSAAETFDLSTDSLEAIRDWLASVSGLPLFTMDFWSMPQEEIQLTDTIAPGTDIPLPNTIVVGLPTGAIIIRAIAIFKFRMVENIFAGINKLQGAQHIQVRSATPGTWRDAVSLVADMFSLAAAPIREGGDVFIGDHDISIEVDSNDTYNFQWHLSLVDGANLQFNDVQVGLRIWYSM